MPTTTKPHATTTQRAELKKWIKFHGRRWRSKLLDQRSNGMLETEPALHQLCNTHNTAALKRLGKQLIEEIEADEQFEIAIAEVPPLTWSKPIESPSQIGTTHQYNSTCGNYRVTKSKIPGYRIKYLALRICGSRALHIDKHPRAVHDLKIAKDKCNRHNAEIVVKLANEKK